MWHFSFKNGERVGFDTPARGMNWKTTTTGVITALSAALSILKAVINGEPFDPALVPAVLAGIGLIFAADAKK